MAEHTLGNLLILAAKQAWRHRQRTLLIGFCVALGNFVLIFQMAQGRGQEQAFMYNMIHALSGHLQLSSPKEGAESTLFAANINDMRPLDELDRLEAALARTAHVKATARRVRFGGMLSRDEDNWSGFLVGVEPDKERRVCDAIALASGRFPAVNSNEIVISSSSARDHGLALGESITVMATTTSRSFNAIEFRIVGLLSESGLSKFYSKLAYIPLDRAQRLIGLESHQAYELVVALDDTRHTEAVAASLRRLLAQSGAGGPVLRTWRDMGGLFIGILAVSQVFRAVMVLFLGAVMLILVFSSFSVYVMERGREIATLMALGLRKWEVFFLFIAEAICVAALAAAAGLAAGGTFVYWLGLVGIPAVNEALTYVFAGERLYPILRGEDMLLLLAGSSVVATLAAALPIRRALRGDFVQTLNRS